MPDHIYFHHICINIKNHEKDEIHINYYLLIVGMWVLSSLNKIKESIKIDKVRAYNATVMANGQLGVMYLHYQLLEERKIGTIELNKEEMDYLSIILTESKRKKHFPTKMPGGQIYTRIIYENYKYEGFVVFGIGETTAVLVDVIEHINFFVTNPDHVKWLQEWEKRVVKDKIYPY